jgi:hypothetical protein
MTFSVKLCISEIGSFQGSTLNTLLPSHSGDDLIFFNIYMDYFFLMDDICIILIGLE